VFAVTASAFASPAVRAIGDSLLAALGITRAATSPAEDMQRYSSPDGTFQIDIPKDWESSPPVYSNSKSEVIRFFPRGRIGPDGLVIFHSPLGPNADIKRYADGTQARFAAEGKSNFVQTEIKISTRTAIRMDYKQPVSGYLAECRHYFIDDGANIYVLGFGTVFDRETRFRLFDRMAMSFVAKP
jgi:hypothetical protein